MGIVRRSNSASASPLHMAPKLVLWLETKSGDYWRLNNATIPDRYRVPASRIMLPEYVEHINPLVCDYHEIPSHEADISKTTVIATFGLFELLRMPFGLKTAAQA